MPSTENGYEPSAPSDYYTPPLIRKNTSKGSFKKLTRQPQVEEKRREMLKQESKDSGIVTEMSVRPKDMPYSPSSSSVSYRDKDLRNEATGSPITTSKTKRSFRKNDKNKVKRSQSVKEKRVVKDRPLQQEHSKDDFEIELLTPKHNGSLEDDQEKKNPSTIRGMWRKAFKTLKSSPSVEKLSKKSSFSKKKQNSKEADEELEQIHSGPVDPVYSLLKCAQDLPRSGGKSPCSMHPHCSGQHPPTYGRYPSGGDSSGNTSKTSSPSSSDLHGNQNIPTTPLTPDSMGSDFKSFYKLSSPAKKSSSAFDTQLIL